MSNLALHYIEDIESVYRLVYRTLKRGGTFLFNIEHPVFTSGVREDWIYDENGDPLYWPVDDYFYPGERKTRFLGCDVLKYHHTLTQIMNGLLRSGLCDRNGGRGRAAGRDDEYAGNERTRCAAL